MNRPEYNLPLCVQFNPSHGVYGIHLAAYLNSLCPAERYGHVMVVHFLNELSLLIV